jgi:hypothetical protein
MKETLIRIQGVPCDAVPQIWPLVCDWVEEALERGSIQTADEVLEKIKNREYQLWLIDDGEPAGAFVTCIATGGRASELVVVCLGGRSMDRWLKAGEDVLSRFAREKGCRRIQMHGRPGWRRKLGSLGWKQKFVNMTKEL